jgi:hypothetical protein
VTLAPGWMFYDGQEILNNARTLAYLQRHGEMGGALRISASAPACLEAAIIPGVEPWVGDQAGWAPPVYDSIFTDQAPWWNPNIPESGDFLGYWVEEITGFDGSHHQRTTSPLGTRLGGATFGSRKDGARTMAFSILLLAESEQGMTHGMRHLEDRLLGPLCDTSCREAAMKMRACCPSPTDLTYGFWEFKNVALVSGPTWSPQPINSGCYVQRVEFTMVCGDPCRYGPPTQVVPPTTKEIEPACNILDRFCGANFGSRVCAVVPRTRYGARGLRVKAIGGANGLPGLRIYTMSVANAVTCDDAIGAPIVRIIQTRPVATPGDGLLIDTGRMLVEYLPDGLEQLAVSGGNYLAYPSNRVLDWPLVYNCEAVVAVEAVGSGCVTQEYVVSMDSFEIEGCAAIYAESGVSGADHGIYTLAE